MDKIDKFTGKYRFLSNFYPSVVRVEDTYYASVEHAYQAYKTNDIAERQPFANFKLTAGEAKKLGKKLTLRPYWDEIKDDIMYILILRKFQNPTLCQSLLETGDSELIEGNTWGDTYWGVCQGKGQNKLGKILMEVRAVYRGR